MPFPTVKHCLVCAAAEPGARGTLNLTGFLGLIPDVAVDSNVIPGGLDLTFLIIGGPGDKDGRRYRVDFDIVDETGKSLLGPQSPRFWEAGEGDKLYLIFSALVAYPAPGKYRLRLLVDKVLHYEAPYELHGC
jgi:hypothetical protein